MFFVPCVEHVLLNANYRLGVSFDLFVNSWVGVRVLFVFCGDCILVLQLFLVVEVGMYFGGAIVGMWDRDEGCSWFWNFGEVLVWASD